MIQLPGGIPPLTTLVGQADPKVQELEGGVCDERSSLPH